MESNFLSPESYKLLEEAIQQNPLSRNTEHVCGAALASLEQQDISKPTIPQTTGSSGDFVLISDFLGPKCISHL